MADLFLIGQNGFVVKVHRTNDIGRDWCRIFGDGYRFVSKLQFRLARGELGWKIFGFEPSASAFNPTLLNGKDITGTWANVTDESVITVGKLKLRVKLVPEEDETRKVQVEKAKRVEFAWKDHFGKTWQWDWDLSERIVREAAREFGLTQPLLTSNYLKKKGYRVEAGKAFVDYPKVAGWNVERMKSIARSLVGLAGTAYSRDKYSLLDFVLCFVQAIPYVVPPDRLGDRKIATYFTPPEVLFYGFGDCDSKCVLLAALWRNIYPDPLIFILLPEHAAIGISGVRLNRAVARTSYDTHIDHQGKEYLVCEPAGPALLPPGVPGKEFTSSAVLSLLDF